MCMFLDRQEKKNSFLFFSPLPPPPIQSLIYGTFFCFFFFVLNFYLRFFGVIETEKSVKLKEKKPTKIE